MSLEDDVLRAHQNGDARALVRLYRRAADEATDTEMAAFYLTHAHVFALECDHPDAATIRQQLIDSGREARLSPPRAPFR